MSVKRPNNLVSFGCLNPIQIVKKDGSTLTVPCRKCSYCRLHHAHVLSQFGSLEASQSDYILFVSLTYANNFVPKVSFEWFSNDLIGDDDDPTFNLRLFDSSTGELFDDLNCKKPSIDYVENVSRLYSKRFPAYFNGNQIPVCYQPHIRDFIKRLNSRCFRMFKKRSCFRYMYCSEYGPRTFRPHYHILFFCKSEQVRSFIYSAFCSYSSKSKRPVWPFGRVDAKYYTGHGCDYVTSYCQGLNTLSAVTFRSTFKSRCRHSQRLGFKALEDEFKRNRKNNPGEFVPFHFVIDGKDKLFCPSSVFENTFYPRCRNFGLLPMSEQLRYYTIAFEYAKRFPNFGLTSPTLLCEHILQEIDEFTSLYGHIEVDRFVSSKKVSNLPYYVKVFGSQFLRYDLTKLRNIVYYDCLISFKFLKAFNSFFSHGTSFSCFVDLINSYYRSKDTYYKKIDDKSINILIQLEDETALQYFEDDKQIDNDKTDYRSSPSFLAWTEYQNKRMVDFSKMKSLKDPYTNKPYTFKDI